MAEPRICPKCGYTSDAGEEVCTSCGAPLSRSSRRSDPRQGVPAVILGPRPWNHRLWRDLDRSQLGLRTLALGLLGGWVGNLLSGIPLLSVLSAVVVLVGAVLVVLGRNVFGPRHAGFAVAGLVLLGFVFVATYFVVGTFDDAIVRITAWSASGIAPVSPAIAFSQAVYAFLEVSAFLGTFGVLAVVLLIHELEPIGAKMALWAALATSGVILFGMALVVGAALSGASTSAFLNYTVDFGPIAAAESMAIPFRVFDLVPTLLLASATFIAWSRIDRGLVPRRAPEPGAALEE